MSGSIGTTGGPYRSPPVSDTPGGPGEDLTFDVSDIQVRVTYRSCDGSLREVGMRFEGDNPEPTQSTYNKRHVYVIKGRDRLKKFMEKGAKEGFVELGDIFVPWHQIFRCEITKTEPRTAIVHWVEQK